MRAQARSRRAPRPLACESRVWEARPSRVSHPLLFVFAAVLARAVRSEPNGGPETT